MAVGNIRNASTYENSWWDWAPLNSCFGTTGIHVSDQDGEVERKGNFLSFETKRPDEELEKGQDRLLRAKLARGGWTVLIIWGEKNLPIRYRLMFGRAVEDGIGDWGAIRKRVHAWFEWADTHPWRNADGRTGNRTRDMR